MASHAESNLSTYSLLVQSLVAVACLQGLYWSCREAYHIRLYAIEEYGLVIHEFDPYFNYRATEYLWEHGWLQFRTWFDYLVWYPLGRPVGTTIYPGMQVTSVLIKKYLLPDMSINDICCFVPAWFGVTATVACGWLTWECTAANNNGNTNGKGNTKDNTKDNTEDPESESMRYAYFNTIVNEVPGLREIYQGLVVPLTRFFLALLQKLTGSTWGLEPRPVHRLTPAVCAVLAAAIMSIIPGHISRSVGGGYDNESIAMTAMVTTFACWTRSLRNGGGSSMNHAVSWGIITGLAYSYMVAAWGGYVFVLNLVGVHASLLVLLGRYSTKLHRAYTAFYLVGTGLAMQVPVVGMTPLKSVEQMGPLLAFVAMQLIEYCEVVRRRRSRQGGGGRGGGRSAMTNKEMWMLRIQVFGVAGIIAVAVAAALYPTGYFGPITSRVRGLFVKHTKTGNPLVDSVAEHQKAPPDAYGQYLQHAVYISPIAFVTTGLFFFNDSSSFLIVYGIAALFFSNRMIRLILLAAPIASAFAGIFLGRFFMWGLGSILPVEDDLIAEGDEDDEEETVSSKGNSNNAKRKQQRKEAAAEAAAAAKTKKGEPLLVRAIRLALSVYAIWWMTPYAKEFHRLSHAIAKQISHPTIIQKATTKSGQTIVMDDYRDAYLWLKEKTPEDARIMAWWDYGYQIAGIANRTTLADGNTWNHEHIALLGYTLTSPEKEAHRIARHLADFVLVWAGGNGDDMNKSPHLRRIANSVYRNICSDPTCRDFNVYSDGSPTPLMRESLVYKLVMKDVVPGVEVDRNRFQEVYKSKYGKVRIYKILSVSKESKEYVADPANRVCDVPGSWFCPGHYPPALKKVLTIKKDFRQLEDFNAKGENEDGDYQKQYLENLHSGHRAPVKPRQLEVLSPDEIDIINDEAEWEDNEASTELWQLISENRYNDLLELLLKNPGLAHIRSSDGRGPMFWAYENNRKEIIHALKTMGVLDTRKDAKGIMPIELQQ